MLNRGLQLAQDLLATSIENHVPRLSRIDDLGGSGLDSGEAFAVMPNQPLQAAQTSANGTFGRKRA
jgi:hypothetical protein